MASKKSVSIIICTCNRARSLERTLGSLGNVTIPAGWTTEVIVVDNASTDDTAAAVRAATLTNMAVVYSFEKKTGKANALNTGIAQAQGEILLFADDDVVFESDWAERMVLPLMDNHCDAVTGLVTLAPHLQRRWLTRMHLWWLASSDAARLHEGSRELIGANMGFHRRVLNRVPAFDPELGPGALGLAEDTLFGWQLIEARFTIAYVPEARVVHHFDESRLRRAYWLGDAQKRGRTEAYLCYHWEHVELGFPRLNSWVDAQKLNVRRLFQPPPPLENEGCQLWEMSYILNSEKCRQFSLERERTRNYSRRGLAKINSPVQANPR